MDSNDILDEMDLPLTSPTEELETISRNLLHPKFDVSKFELRPEIQSDKGIDINVEVKKSGKHTNFRFIIQLKATESTKVNQDGSISLQIDTSNINYLLNSGVPAFYILYSKSQDIFFYEHINDFVKILSEKDSTWGNQGSHVLRFSKRLDDLAISEMYNITISKGIFHRKINEKFAINASTIQDGDKILVDRDLNISDDSEIRTLVEDLGLTLINESKWKEILVVHNKASQNIATTAKYNLVLGIANYYNGDLLRALTFFKDAIKKKNELTDDLVNHLLFFDTSVRFYIGLISEDNYKKKIKEFEKDSNLTFYIKLEQIKDEYLDSSLINDADTRFAKLENDICEIINNPEAPSNIKLIAKSELLFFQGSYNNMSFIRSVMMINAIESTSGPSPEMRKKSLREFLENNNNRAKLFHQLKDEALQEKNYFAYYNAVINELKVTYEIMVYTDNIYLYKEIPGVSKQERPEKEPIFESMLSQLNDAYNYYKYIGHIENLILVLSRKYEILHYIQEIPEANKVILELEIITNSYDSQSDKVKLENLKNKGTSHERFNAWFIDTETIIEQQREECEKMIIDMERMDEEERLKVMQKENLQIQLFPIGDFQFPSSSKEKIFEILGINENETLVHFENFFKLRLVPIVNIYNNPIKQEGLMDGILSDKGIESWKNIYRVRKAFYENNFYRISSSPYSYSPE